MANSFGDVVEQLGALKNLFGGQGNSVPNQQGFSSQPAQENMAMQNASAFQAALQNLGVSKDAASFGSGLSSQGYQDRLNADFNQAVKMKDLNRSAGGGGSIVGKGAWADSQTMADHYGMSGMKANFQGLKDFTDRQNMAAQSEEMFGAINARNEGAKAREIAMAQAGAQQHLMASQNAIDTARMQREQAFQGIQSAAERGSRERVAATQAQAGILSSLFGSVGAGSPNYRYWG